MKRLITLIVAIIILSGLGWYAYHLKNSSGLSSSELIAFNIKNVEQVNKLIITDAQGKKITIIKGNPEWTTESGECIQQESVGFILEALKNIEFKGYLPENSRERMITLLSTQHTKVEIFENDEWTKTWYIGPPSQDHYGQIMLLDSDEYGKSDLPVIMKIKGLNGIIEPRFFADYRKWMCTKILAISADKIKKVEVKYLKEPSRSFSVVKNSKGYDVFQQGNKLPTIDSSMIFTYLNRFKNIHFEGPNYTLTESQVDSVKSTTPFATLNIIDSKNDKTFLKLFKIKTDIENRNEFGVMEPFDMDRFWCQLPNGQLVKCQYFVFHPLLLGHVYFPMNLKGVKRADMAN